MVFRDRKDAGAQLAEKLKKYESNHKVVILGLPRGGVVTAYEVAKKLKVPLDMVVPRKIGAPGNPELAIGAIAQSGQAVFNKNLIKSLNVPREYIEKEIEKEKEEAERRISLYRNGREPVKLKDKTVILVDDGIATGSTMLAAIASVRTQKAGKIVVAVPVISRDSITRMKNAMDELVYLDAPMFFSAVGQFYEHFEQTSDEEVIDLMSHRLYHEI